MLRVDGTLIFPFPEVNASLNAASAVLIVSGVAFIKKRNIFAHRACMLAAAFSSLLFLISYLTYHAKVGSVHFQGQGWVRPVYFSLLISHSLLAAVIVPLVLRTLTLGLMGRFEKHTAIARWTYPLWMYVSITGVIVYWMLYRISWKV